MRINKTLVVEASLVESSLSRLWRTMQDFDTGTITAFRNENKYKTNLERNRLLLADLRRLYNVTSVKGSFIENYGTNQAVETDEDTYFVSDVKSFGTLRNDLTNLGVKYEQDSVMFIPKGGKSGTLIGTKDGVYPGLGNQELFSNPVFGSDGRFMTSVKGRPFTFKNEAAQHFTKDGPLGFFGEWGRWATTRKVPKD